MNGDIQAWPVQNNFFVLASAKAQTAAFEGILWLFGIIVLTTLVGLIGVYLRRHYRKAENSSTLGLTLEQLKWLRDRGDLLDAEYKMLRVKLLADIRSGHANTITRPVEATDNVLQQS